MGLKEQIKAASVRKPLKVHVKEWNLDVFVRVLSVGERDDWSWPGLTFDKGVEKFPTSERSTLLAALRRNGVRIFQDNDWKKYPNSTRRRW